MLLPWMTKKSSGLGLALMRPPASVPRNSHVPWNRCTARVAWACAAGSAGEEVAACANTSDGVRTDRSAPPTEASANRKERRVIVEPPWRAGEIRRLVIFAYSVPRGGQSFLEC